MLPFAYKAFEFLQNCNNMTSLKLRCYTRFSIRLLIAVGFSKVIMFVGSNQSNYFENTTTCSKTRVTTQLYECLKTYYNWSQFFTTFWDYKYIRLNTPSYASYSSTLKASSVWSSGSCACSTLPSGRPPTLKHQNWPDRTSFWLRITEKPCPPSPTWN